MPKAMILSPAQAGAAYAAMCVLREVRGKIDVIMPAGGGIGARVRETWQGSILVAGEFRGEAHGGPWKEIYEGQTAFALAYGLKQA